MGRQSARLKINIAVCSRISSVYFHVHIALFYEQYYNRPPRDRTIDITEAITTRTKIIIVKVVFRFLIFSLSRNIFCNTNAETISIANIAIVKVMELTVAREKNKISPTTKTIDPNKAAFLSKFFNCVYQSVLFIWALITLK